MRSNDLVAAGPAAKGHRFFVDLVAIGWESDGDVHRGRLDRPALRKQGGESAKQLHYARRDSNLPPKIREKQENGKITAHSTSHFDPILQRVIDAWPLFSEETRRAILALVECTPDAPENAYGGSAR